jgi:uncharacterized protein (DUF1330 family)
MAGYVIVEVDVHDAATFEEYRKQVPATIAKYGGRYLVRGGKSETIEGGWNPKRIVVLEFPTVEQARKFYDSPDYDPQKALRLRAAHCKGIIVEGV